MSKIGRLKLDGRNFVVLERAEYERLVRLSRVLSSPSVSRADAVRKRPAVEYARTSIAEEILRRRTDAGLTQPQLAARAGIRVETLCRIETRRNMPSTATIAAIEAVLIAAERKHGRRRRTA